MKRLAASRLAPIAALALGASAHAQNGAAPEEIVFSMDSWARQGDTYTFRGVRIESGDVLIEAGQAVTTTSGFEEFDGRWELSESILVAVGTVRLSAESAAFDFSGGELIGGELTGEPATFVETEPKQAGPVRAEASRIVYEREARIVQMLGSASFTMGQNSMSGCDFVYELGDGVASGSSECGVPLSIIYRPRGNGDSPDEPDTGEADEPAATQNESAPAP